MIGESALALEAKEKPKFFYGWVVVFALAMVQGATVGFLGNTMSVFIKPVSTGLGITRATFLLNSTFQMLSSVFMAPVWGEFFRNRRFKPYMIAGCFITASAMFGNSFAQKMSHFYIVAFFRGLFSGMLMGISMAKILSNWFVEKRGFATGLALSGSGLAGSFMTPIISRTVEMYGWRAGYRQLGIVFFVITVPVILFLLRETPEEMGLTAYGAESTPKLAAGAPVVEKQKVGISRAQAMRSQTYWFYVIGLFFVQGCVMSTSNNTVNHLTDIGYEPAFAASIFSIVLLMLVPGKPILGKVYDVLGIRTGTIIITGMTIVSPLLLAFSHIKTIAYVYAVVFGLAYSIATMQLPYMTVRLMGDKELSRVYGMCQPFQQLGSALMVPVSNIIQVRLGSYVPVFFSLSIMLTMSLFMMLRAIKMSPIEQEKFMREDAMATQTAQAPA